MTAGGPAGNVFPGRPARDKDHIEREMDARRLVDALYGE